MLFNSQNKIRFFLKLMGLVTFSGFILISQRSFADLKSELPERDSAPPAQNKEKNHESHSHPDTSPKHMPKEKKKDSQEGDLSTDFENHNMRAPVFFSGNHGEGFRKTGTLYLEGNVLISQDGLNLKSDRSEIISATGGLPSAGSNKIKTALAKGNVLITKKATDKSPELKANCDTVEFQVLERILTLQGNAKVWRGNEYINGEAIKINLNTGGIDIIRPVGTINPQQENNRFKNKSSVK